jgi:hypothetical protein
MKFSKFRDVQWNLFDLSGYPVHMPLFNLKGRQTNHYYQYTSDIPPNPNANPSPRT